MQDLFGQRSVAVMTGVGDPKAVGRWASGHDVPREDAAATLLNTVRVVEVPT